MPLIELRGYDAVRASFQDARVTLVLTSTNEEIGISRALDVIVKQSPQLVKALVQES